MSLVVTKKRVFWIILGIVLMFTLVLCLFGSVLTTLPKAAAPGPTVEARITTSVATMVSHFWQGTHFQPHTIVLVEKISTPTQTSLFDTAKDNIGKSMTHPCLGVVTPQICGQFGVAWHNLEMASHMGKFLAENFVRLIDEFTLRL